MDRINNFVNFLHRVSTKKSRERVDPSYEDLKLSIILVGRSDVIKHYKYGYEPYVSYVKHAIKEGIETFYVLARGKLNTFIAWLVATELEKENAVIITDRYVDEIKYENATVDVAYYRLSVK